MKKAPLGARENERREFKSREALGDRRKIAREIVAMLNAAGGELWLGIREENGFAVEVEPIPNASKEASRFLDSLVDSIEPPPGPGEVRVEPVSREGGQVLRVEVARGGSRPYALLGTGGARTFLTRIGARLRPMAREEIRREFGDSVTEGTHDREILQEARRQLLDERLRFEEAGGVVDGSDGFWMAIRPVAPLNLDPQEDRFSELLTDPTLTANRRSGWTFVAWQPPRVTSDRLVGSRREDAPSGPHGQQIEIHADGEIVFKSSLSRLHWQGQPNELWPLIVLELPVSIFRLAARVYEGRLRDEAEVLADAALFGVSGWTLRGGSPGAFFSANTPHTFEEGRDLVLPGGPVQFRFRQVREEPDRCGFRIVRQIYAEFGFREEAIPREFDRDTGRLVLPE